MLYIRSALSVAIAAAFSHGALAQGDQSRQQQAQQQQQQAQQQQQQQQAKQQGQQQRMLTVADVRNQQLFSQNGERLGQIQGVVLDDNERGWLIVSDDGQRFLAPFNYLALRNGRYVLVGAEQMNMRPYNAQSGNLRQLQADHPLRVAGYDRGVRRSWAEPAEIVIRDPEPRVAIDQAQPSVRVQQPAPQVTVDQARPQIIVRQPPPTITVQQPQPEIIVRMPEPDVNVQMQQPEVAVNVPPPQVRFADTDRQAQVAPTVQAAEPRVRVIPPQQQADINVNQAQPQVRFERTGEPQVRYSESQGEPRIRYEQMGQGEQGAAAGGTRERE